MTGRQEYDRTKDRQRILGKYIKKIYKEIIHIEEYPGLCLQTKNPNVKLANVCTLQHHEIIHIEESPWLCLQAKNQTMKLCIIKK